MARQPGIIVIQHGARHRYAVPRMFHRMGYLVRLVTDSHAGSYLGRAARIASTFFPLPPSAERLNDRQIQAIPRYLVRSADSWSWMEKRLRKRHGKDTAAWLQARDDAWYSLTKDTIPERADILYAMGGENLKLLSQARRRGIKVIVDAFISPLNLRQTYEAKRECGMPASSEEKQYPAVEAHYQAVFREADAILCPSRWVAEGVETLDPQFRSKIRICPYGSSLNLQSGPRNPVPGRIFWAGGDWFRKGLHHLAAAADSLIKTHPEMEFRVAGIADPAVQSMVRFANMKFLGKLDRAGMEREFATADLFVFPTLTEGMASVLVEAVASGCPVLTTRGAGFDALEDGKGGLLFEAGDPQALAERIETLYLDRRQLETMSGECAVLAADFTEEAWAARLKHIIAELAA